MIRNSIFILSACLTLTSCYSESPEKVSQISPEVQKTDNRSSSETKKPPTSFLEEDDQTQDYASKYTNRPPKDEKIVELTNYTCTKPASWIWTPPKSTFVKANYILPAVLNSDSGLLTVSEFMIGEGGDFNTNVERWNSMFRTDRGAPVKPVFSIFEIRGSKCDAVHFKGEYMGAGAAWHKTNHTLYIVLYEDSEMRYFFKMLGPTETIEAHRESLYSMLQSLKPAPVE